MYICDFKTEFCSTQFVDFIDVICHYLYVLMISSKAHMNELLGINCIVKTLIPKSFYYCCTLCNVMIHRDCFRNPEFA